MNEVAGQFIIWNKGASPRAERNAVVVFGVLGMPPELAERFGRDDNLKRLVVGSYIPDLGLSLSVREHETEEVTSHYKRGHTVDTLFTSPIWRV
jgi:hypothetical protein